MRLIANKDGEFVEYMWTTPNNYEISTSQVEEVRAIVKEEIGEELSFETILRMVDIFKSFENK